MICRILPLLTYFILFQKGSTEKTCVSDGKEDGHSTDRNYNVCTLFMAESSIKNSGFGVFTTRRYDKGEFIQPLGDAPSIAITDIVEHYGEEPDWAHVNYYWDADGYTGFEAEDVAEMVLTLGTIANYHPYLNNVEHTIGGYDDTILNRFSDPGAGAFSYYEGQKFLATREIRAGEELFTNYGENWLDTREGTFADKIPRKDDYVKAAQILSRLRAGWSHGKLNEFEYDIVPMVNDIVGVVSKRVSSLIPKTKEGLEMFLKVPKRHGMKKIEEIMALGTTDVRSITWIEENGICLDNIIPKRSTLKQAGKGAFAQRFIPQGSIVVPIPLLPILNKDSLDMFDLSGDGNQDAEAERKVVGRQLLLNYCFGHTKSPMLLCPSSNAVLINHCSGKNLTEGGCTQSGPNAEIRWAEWDKTNKPWLNASLESLQSKIENDKRGLSFDVIALRDIKAGEEIFINYGEDWESSYVDHLDMWKSPRKGDEAANYKQINQLKEDKATIRTEAELIHAPYPGNVRYACYKYYDQFDAEPDDDVPLFYNDEFSSNGSAEFFGYRNEDEIFIVNQTAPNQVVSSGQFHIPDINNQRDGWYWPCQALERTGQNEYTVRILHTHDTSDIGWARNKKARILTSYPADSVIFIPEKYSSDQFLPSAFRHHIGIRDEIFPKQWKVYS